MDATGLVRRYYDALDAHDYDELEAVLAPEFTQRRPDRRFESRAAFVAFMREERPNSETTHELEAVIAAESGDDDGSTVAVRGRVRNASTVLFEFADFFAVDEGTARIERLETYSR
ncbi:nuclear transport factor 2 family protein [Natrialba aegyptia]|uniref:SnoaL-like domain-containing protein n=1 Tax=Natrialba aegyptia DSM 13077 TaxID=1227491 RepID=M0AZM4_9EURY|nr:nuclear transport factor 2 family protein [Natrialba aegyptia]ELZ04096.1 hypothetical protein C480_11306 [Natrialba aegyptia DSM 13077]